MTWRSYLIFHEALCLHGKLGFTDQYFYDSRTKVIVIECSMIFQNLIVKCDIYRSLAAAGISLDSYLLWRLLCVPVWETDRRTSNALSEGY